MDLSLLAEQNPWWENGRLIETDFHLQALKPALLHIRHPIETHISLDEDRLYILRGPRQVGKTTLIKKLVQRLLFDETNPRRILYFAFDIGGIRNAQQAQDLLRTYLSWARGQFEMHRLFVFLDEVTYVPDWSTGIKAAYDQGMLTDVTLIATGSSIIDLKRGGERLPGRRGKSPHKNDLVMAPLSFRNVLCTLYPDVLFPSIAGQSLEDLYNTVFDMSLQGEKIKRAFDAYLLTGGYPLPIISHFRDSHIDRGIYHTYLQVLLGDMGREGKRESYAREILYQLISKWFEPISWDMLSQETSIGSHNTVAEYIEFLEMLFIIKPLYQVHSLGSAKISFRKRRKVYFLDPFIFHLNRAWTSGLGDPCKGSLAVLADPQRKAQIVEQVVAAHLLHTWSDVLFWRNKEEIDFICIKERSPLWYIESKYQPVITSGDKKALKKAGGGIILSRDTMSMDRDNNIITVPVSYFLAAL